MVTSEDVGDNIDLRIPVSVRRQTSGDLKSLEARKQFMSQTSRSGLRASIHKSSGVILRKRRNIRTYGNTTHSAFQRYERDGGLPQTQKDQLLGQYKRLAVQHDRRLLEADYIDRNIANVGDPSFVRMASSTASLIHRYRRQQKSARETLATQAMHI